MKLEERLFQIWLSLRCRVVDATVRELLKNYGSPYELYAASDMEICGMPCSESMKEALRDKDLSEANRILDACKSNNIEVLFWQEEKYPISLGSINDPPLLLYYVGQLPDLNRKLCVSVVGSRTAGDYARRAAYQISYEMATVGTVVVSGMALGVDAIASAGALAGGGETVAVLACGVDLVYPASHRKLRDAIIKRGAVISEYPPGTLVEKHHFPARNRIISGLSQGTLIVQAAQGSGALITANDALEQGRNVFALPGQMNDKAAEGTNMLLRDGAIFVQDVMDILGKYEVLFADVLKMKALHGARKHSELDEDFCQELGVRCKQDFADESTPPRSSRSSRSSSTRKDPPVPKVIYETKTEVQKAPVEAKPQALPYREGDNSEMILSTLTERQRQMFALLPLDRAVPVGYLVKEGFTTPEVLANMTILASKGLVSVLPGSLYIRA